MSLLVVGFGLFVIGLYGVLTRRDIVGIFASVEVMIGAGLLLFVGLAAPNGSAGAEAVGVLGVVAVAAEAAVGLSLLVAVARRRGTTRADELDEVNG